MQVEKSEKKSSQGKEKIEENLKLDNISFERQGRLGIGWLSEDRGMKKKKEKVYGRDVMVKGGDL